MKPPVETNCDVWVKQGDSPDSSSLEHEDMTESQSALIRHGTKSNDVFPTRTLAEPDELSVIPTWKRYAGVAILTFINLLNYMDRFTIAGVLMEIKDNFQINNAQTGLLQTVFIISYMVVAPLFGYLGDRFNRIWIMVAGMAMWSGFTLMSSFIQKPEHFVLFLMSRALVGIGEASYATIAPTLIGDMFVGSKRTQMLSVFFFATPIGSGLGYIVGAAVAKAFGGWEWALRVTPGLGVLAIILLILFCPNPPRGASESSGASAGVRHSYCNDIKYLIKNKSFIFVTFGFTFMAFVVGSLTLWGPTYVSYGQIAIGAIPACQSDGCDNSQISFIFGVITCVAGFAGVGIGAESARRWKMHGRKNADALVCGIGLLLGAPLLFCGIQYAQSHLTVAWILIFFADLSLCTTWTLISDMTLYVTEPNRRSTANAVQLLIGHLFGDAGSPYLLGVVADALAVGAPDTYMTKYISLQRAIYIALFGCVAGAAFFFLASMNVVADKKKVDDFLKAASSKDSSGTGSLELDSRPNETGPMINGVIPPKVQSRSDSLDSDGLTEDLLLSNGSLV